MAAHFPIILSSRCPILALMLGCLLVAPAQGSDWVRVERSELAETVRLDGVVESRDHASISADIGGRVLAVSHDVGDALAKGTLVVELDQREVQARLEQARAAHAQATAQRDDAERRFARQQRLYEQNAIAQSEFEQAQFQRDATQAEVERASAAIDEAEKYLSDTMIRAPFDGVMRERYIEPGESVSPGQALFSVLSLERLRVVVSIPQRYFDRERQHDDFKVETDQQTPVATESVTFFPTLDTAAHSVRARLSLKNEKAVLFPGMYVRVSLVVGVREALWIPASALIQRSELRAVKVLDEDNIPRLRQVRIGVEDGGRLEVLAGLSEGERVLREPQRD